MKKYIARSNTWFDEGTECWLVVDCSQGDYQAGIFYGTRTSEGFRGEYHPEGQKYEDQEYCTFDEFDIIEG